MDRHFRPSQQRDLQQPMDGIKYLFIYIFKQV